MKLLQPPRHHSELERQAVGLRSDTFRLPTQEMYEALRRVARGDDVYGEDPTVRLLEALAAEQTGKEAAPLVTSATQGNLTVLVARRPRGRRAAA
jgi:threonine aldolase